MKMNGKIVETLNKEFLVVKIDFYNNGEDLGYFVFNKNEVDEEKVAKLYDDYNEQYSNGEFAGTFEDYLQAENINYDVLTFYEM